MTLVIVESPTKARTLSRFLGNDFRIEASMGHVRDLPESRLGIDVDKDFAPEYVIAEKKEAKVRELQKAAESAAAVILATDPDREGEAIAWHIANILKIEDRRLKIEVEDRKSKIDKKNLPSNFNPQPQSSLIDHQSSIKRIVFHEITESAIKEALLHPREIDMNLVDAQQARRVLDRLVGYKLSPLLWRKIRRGLSAGRVQSVAVRLIVDREREIQAFKVREYWEIAGQFKVHEQLSTVNEFVANLVKVGDQPAEIKNEAAAKDLVSILEKADYQVAEVMTKEVKRHPYPPFTTSTLQQAASNLFGWSAKKTMQVAQNLYEQGLITYHRTDSTNLAAEAVTAVRNYISSQSGAAYLPEKPKYYATRSKVAQEAHEAIRPTSVKQLAVSSEGTERDQNKLYELVWKRFVACQMNEAVYEQTSVDVVASCHSGEQSNSSQEYLFRTTGSRQIFDGWQKIMQNVKVKMENGAPDKGENGQLPELAKFDKLDLLGLTPSQHFTEPPPRYNEASLIKTLEEYGIGRPSTYAPIISTIQDRQYVEKVDKKFYPSALGFAVNDFLQANFANVMDYKFTALMEDELDAIANGEKKWAPVIQKFYEPFAAQLLKVTDTAERVKVAVEDINETCPEDGGKLVIRVGRFGKFISCANFPKCRFTKQFQQKLDIKCPKCGGDVVLKRTKSRKSFYGCSNYPTCNFASWTKPK